MKNKNIAHARQAVKIYQEHYQPSFNLWRFTKSILGVLFFGTSTVPGNYSPINKRTMK